jgi:hypothetical protein
VYRYNGRDITTTMPYNPGSTVRVAVGIADGPPAGTPAPVGTTVREASTPPPPPPGTAVSNPGGYRY